MTQPGLVNTKEGTSPQLLIQHPLENLILCGFEQLIHNVINLRVTSFLHANDQGHSPP